jgi:CDP-glucose 4,6-dehydratase
MVESCGDTFWRGRRVLVTGHTGIKGSWLCLRLLALGAEVSGFALEPDGEPNLFDITGLRGDLRHLSGDVRDGPAVIRAVQDSGAEVIFHLAAQALVRPSYDDPAGTFATNVMGTVHVMEAARRSSNVRALVCVTSDKCYENREDGRLYREDDAMGGHDPYSSSKGCAELVVSAYRRSFFNQRGDGAVATVRAGNVIGGGDWSRDRLIPDLLRGLAAGERPLVRFPAAIRPWQHVLEPLNGYLMLAERLAGGDPSWAGAWNFGPAEADCRPVSWIADRLAAAWSKDSAWTTVSAAQPHEAATLKLDSAKARQVLGWRPVWRLEEALGEIVSWQRAYLAGADMRAVTERQIRQHADLAGLNLTQPPQLATTAA